MKPINIKFERIYMPCILMTKKRYTGCSYNPNSIAQNIFTYVIDVKGIEAIRRDSPPLLRDSMRESLRELFNNNDMS